MKTVFNKSSFAWSVGALLLCAAGGKADRNAAPATEMFRDGPDWVQAIRLPGAGAELTPISLSLQGGTGRASVGKRAIVQLGATPARRAAALFRAQRVRAIHFAATAGNASASKSLSPQPSAARAAQLALGPDAEDPPAPLNPRLGLYLVESVDPREDGLALAARLSNVAGVESAIPDLYYERKLADFEVPPNDPRYSAQWYLRKLSIERAWKVASGNRDTTIVVIDDGCDMHHPDLEASMLGGLDVLDDDDDPSYAPNIQGNEHGTACSGIIAAIGNNDIGIAGVCPTCTLRCVRLFDKSHSLIPVSADIRAFNYAFDTGAAVVSNSWGFSEPQPVPNMVRATITELLENGRGGKGAVVAFAAGNENRVIQNNEIAAIPGVLNVGAVTTYDELTSFSNTGESLSLTAPTGTFTTDISGPDGDDPSDYTGLFGGTSSACPVVAGVAALVMSAVPDVSAKEVTSTLIATARPAPFATPDAKGHDDKYGHGIIDPSAALTALGIDVPAAAAAPDAGKDDEPEKPDGGKPDRDRGAKANEDDGCGCTVPGHAREPVMPLIMPAMALWFAMRVRRRRK